MIITIDGPAGTGKSTVAHRVAQHLGFMELDTGALYRAVAAACILFKVNPHDEEQVRAFILKYPLHIDFSTPVPSYSMNHTDLTPLIRSLDVTSIVSYVAANPHVRQALLPVQKDIAKGRNVVSEGRDMGTTVFPEADIKFFLTASSEVRAKRRYDELKEKGTLPFSTTLEMIQAQIEKRDTIDQGRKNSPLRKASDAVEIDTSALTLDEVVTTLLNQINKANLHKLKI